MKTYFCLCLMTLLNLLVLSSQNAESLDKKVPYYSSTYFYCDSSSVKTSEMRSQIDFVSWILPDNTLLKADQSRRKVRVSPDGYNITISNVNDDVFGYYHCIILMKKPAEILSIQFGLNIDGADFSDLHEQFRRSAIVGGIAAAVMVAVFGAGCLIWNYRYSSKHKGQRNSIEMKHGSHIETYENTVFDGSVGEKENLPFENVTPVDGTPNIESGISESEKL